MSIGTLYHRSITDEEIFVECDTIETHVRTCCRMCLHVIHMNSSCGSFVRASTVAIDQQLSTPCEPHWANRSTNLQFYKSIHRHTYLTRLAPLIVHTVNTPHQ